MIALLTSSILPSVHPFSCLSWHLLTFSSKALHYVPTVSYLDIGRLASRAGDHARSGFGGLESLIMPQLASRSCACLPISLRISYSGNPLQDEQVRREYRSYCSLFSSRVEGMELWGGGVWRRKNGKSGKKHHPIPTTRPEGHDGIVYIDMGISSYFSPDLTLLIFPLSLSAPFQHLASNPAIDPSPS